ncbi:FecR family protein [Paucibacter sp. DJ2R-2]|uniref:FecR family protein n=1 Tax=Paucibacter sp. DJ2R-2 TaxID=2893558 RepID=UPI0021E4E40D|nr:FecR domain-containing protein [Paucibacter sp. DJ2R-2]MCV2438697.1 FecR domain-containing protein [Paucibacter sp. DJ2R-2]
MDASADPDSKDTSGPHVTPEIAAEASVWIARLHGPDRGPEMERECLAWQARSAAHRLAFERCTDVWESVPGVRLADAFASASRRASDAGGGGEAGPGSQRSASRIWILAPAFIVLLAGGSGYWHFVRGGESFGTQVGEQQQLMLVDGTRMTLNTDTQVRVDMGTSKRTVELQRGEALFEVSKDPERPFVVKAGGNEVEAIGTVFSVRMPGGSGQGSQESAVTLIEGQVAVRPPVARDVRGSEADKAVLMQPGERLRWVPQELGASRPVRPQLDRPKLATVLAWRRNEVDFEDASLMEATSEMNRYSRTPIVLLGNGTLGTLRVSGLYRTGDSAGFAHAVAALHGLRLREQGGRLELSQSQ